MGISIPEEKITDALITAYMKHRRGPESDLIWQEHFQELADMLIKHGIVSPLVRWTEITDDPATLPPVGMAVWTQSDQNEVEVLVRNDGTLSGQDVHYWERPAELYLGTNQKFEFVCLSHASVAITHWRPI